MAIEVKWYYPSHISDHDRTESLKRSNWVPIYLLTHKVILPSVEEALPNVVITAVLLLRSCRLRSHFDQIDRRFWTLHPQSSAQILFCSIIWVTLPGLHIKYRSKSNFGQIDPYLFSTHPKKVSLFRLESLHDRGSQGSYVNLHNKIVKFFPSLLGRWYVGFRICQQKGCRRSGFPLGVSEVDLKLRSKHS